MTEITAQRIAMQINAQSGGAQIGIILGSGWGKVTDKFESKKVIPYSSLEGMPLCGVEGHSGNFVTGIIATKKVIAMQGRFHLYEGKTVREVTLPIRIMQNLGVKTLIITNASGGVNPAFNVGDIMLISDHINLSGANPLTALKATKESPVFIDMGGCYDKELTDSAQLSLEKLGVACRRGVYLQVSGPSYETHAEIRAFSALGADAVGMSTAIECIFARYLGLKVLGLSLITNKAAGLSEEALSHGDVLKVSSASTENLSEYLNGIIYSINV